MVTHGRCGRAGAAAQLTICGLRVDVLAADARAVKLTHLRSRQDGRGYVTCRACLSALDELRARSRSVTLDELDTEFQR